MKTPHKHAELIKAWADGHEIEFLDLDGIWKLTTKPQWVIEAQYRIKPEVKQPVVRWQWAYWHDARKSWSVTDMMLTEEEASLLCSKMTKIEATRTEFPE